MMTNKSLLRVFNFSFLLIILCSCQTEQSAQKTQALSQLKIAVQPNEADKDFSLLSSELEKRVGLKISFVPTKDYSDALDLFRNDKVDFAFFSPLNFIQAEKEGIAKVLLKKIYENSEFYYSALVVKKSSSVKKIQDLQNKVIALVDPQSVSGFTYPKYLLQKSGLQLSDDKILLAGTHKNAIEAVIAGKAEAAGVWSTDESGKQGAWIDHGQGQAFRVLKVSEPIPNDAFVVRQKLYDTQAEIVLKMMEALIAVSELPNHPLKATFGTNRLTTATSRHYDSVRELQKQVEK